MNQSVRVEDIKIDNYEILNSPRVPVVSVSLTRQLREEPTAAEAVAATPAEGAAAPAEAAAGGTEKEKEKEKK